jgi:hypothetical protein
LLRWSNQSREDERYIRTGVHTKVGGEPTTSDKIKRCK